MCMDLHMDQACCAKHLESGARETSPTYSLRDSGRRPLSRSSTLGSPSPSLLFATSRTQPRLPRQVRCWLETTPSPAGSLQRSPAASPKASLCFLPASSVSARMGGLPQTALRQSTTCAPLSRRLHPPSRHLQSSPSRLPARSSDLPLE